MAQTHAAAPLLVAEVDRATTARDPRALALALEELVGWVRQGTGGRVDEVYARWLSVQPCVRSFDLSIFHEDRTGIDSVGICLAQLDYYRQVDLSVDERFDLLTRVRELLSPRHYLACARVDLERAKLLSRRDEKEAVSEALSLCDDALACVEQLEDEEARADAMFTRAHVLANADRTREALVEAGKARRFYEEHERTHAVANVCLFLAEVHVMVGRIPEASVVSAEAIAGYERDGDSVGKARALSIRAHCWKARGKRANALRDCQEAVSLFDTACLRAAQGRIMIFLANLEADAGMHAEARGNLEAAVEYLRESPERSAFVLALLKLADLLNRRGQLAAAAAALDEAESQCGTEDGKAARLRPPVRIRLLLELCRIAKETSTPDKPRLRRISAEAMRLARELRSVDLEDAARAYAAYAG